MKTHENPIFLQREEKVRNVSMAELVPLFQEQLEMGRSVRFAPRGVSMLPMLRPGLDTVVLSPAPERLRKYDLPLYRRDNGHYVLHRVVEAGETSGALITARHAVYQNKPVFAVPGTLGDAHAGTNALLKNGARLATSPTDILAELAMEHPTEIHPEHLHLSKQIYARGNAIHTTDEDEPFPELDDLTIAPEPPVPTVCEEHPTLMEGSLAERICGTLKNRAMSADELSCQLGVGISDLLGELTELEIEGKVQSLAGNRFTCI
jgi:hypothetical protein